MVTVHATTMVTILADWIRSREKYEINELKFTRDSSLLATGRDLLEAAKKGEMIAIEGNVDD